MFDVIPDELVRVKIGSVGWQKVEFDLAFSPSNELPDNLCSVSWMTINYEVAWSSDSFGEVFKHLDEECGIETRE